jgi:hypothetical protein
MAAAAQEAVRVSTASAEAAEARNRAATDVGYYNLKLGPTAWRFTSGLGIDYNDNVNYTQNNPEGDVIFRPQVGTHLLWPLSEKNSLDLSLGVGYSAYVVHSSLDRLFITPDTGLAFNLYAGDFWINLHDRFSISENTYQDPTVAGTGNYSELQNTIGATTQWDLNKALLRLNLDHQNYSALSGTSTQPDGTAETASLTAGYAPKQGILFGLEGGGGLLHYSGANAIYSDATEWNVGAFYNAQLTDHIALQSSGGYTTYSPTSTGTTATPFSGTYWQLSLTHQISQHVDYSLNGSHTINSTLQGGSFDMYTTSLQINWRIIKDVTLSTSFIYNHGSQLIAFGETFDQYGPQISLGRSLTKKLSSSIGYQAYWRNSDQPGRSYTVNIVSLNLMYNF